MSSKKVFLLKYKEERSPPYCEFILPTIVSISFLTMITIIEVLNHVIDVIFKDMVFNPSWLTGHFVILNILK